MNEINSVQYTAWVLEYWLDRIRHLKASPWTVIFKSVFLEQHTLNLSVLLHQFSRYGGRILMSSGAIFECRALGSCSPCSPFALMKLKLLAVETSVGPRFCCFTHSLCATKFPAIPLLTPESVFSLGLG